MCQLIGFANISASCFRNLKENSSLLLAALIISAFSLFKKIFCRSISHTKHQGFQNLKKMWILGSGKSNGRDPTKYENKVFEIIFIAYVNEYLLSIALTLKTTV